MATEHNDFSNIGDELKKIVQDAVDSRNFRELSSQIQETVNTALDSASSIVKSAGEVVNSQMQKAQEAVEKAARSDNAGGGRPLFGDGGLLRRPEKGHRTDKDPDAVLPANTRLFAASPRGATAGQLQRIGGGIFSAAFGIGLLANGASILSGIIEGLPLSQTLFGAHAVNFWLCLVFLLASLFVFARGTVITGFVKRFRRYASALEGKPFAAVADLSQRTGIPQGKISADLPKMIEQRMFRQGHLTALKDCLIVTDKAYEQYQNVQEQQMQKQQEANAFVRSAPDPETARECARIMEEGNEWLDHIRRVNDQLPQQDISDKLDKLEKGVNRIFTEVKKQPAKAKDLHKFMNYYLPTTGKLIDAYAELEKQQDTADSAHAAKTKAQIEEALDTINAAFDKLFDKLFAARAMDISADISVLETMLAQEGLTKNDFE